MKAAVLAICALLLSSAHAWALNHPSFPWCGWYARHYIAVMDPGEDYNRARAWMHWGTGVNIPCPGCIVVWPHHVGMITGHCHDHICNVVSGNDGHRVRERARSIANAVIRKGPTVLASYPIEEVPNDEHVTRTVHPVHTAHVAQHSASHDHRYIRRSSVHHVRSMAGTQQHPTNKLDVI